MIKNLDHTQEFTEEPLHHPGNYLPDELRLDLRHHFSTFPRRCPCHHFPHCPFGLGTSHFWPSLHTGWSGKSSVHMHATLVCLFTKQTGFRTYFFLSWRSKLIWKDWPIGIKSMKPLEVGRQPQQVSCRLSAANRRHKWSPTTQFMMKPAESLL